MGTGFVLDKSATLWYNISMKKLKRQMRKIVFYLKNFFLPQETNNHLPYSLRLQPLVFVVILALLVKSFSFISWFALMDRPFFADITSGLVVYFSNQERQAVGLSQLVENPALDQAALDKALDMLAKDYFSHNAPDGASPWHWFSENGYAYKYAGENLAVDFYESKDVVRAWMDSPTHKFNILNNNYQEIGVAVVKGSLQGRETILVVQLFGTQKTKLAQASPQPSPMATVGVASPSVVVSARPTPPILPSVRPSPTVSPIVAGEETGVSPSVSPGKSPVANFTAPPQTTPKLSVEPTTSPVFAGLSARGGSAFGGQTNPPAGGLPIRLAIAEKLVDLTADPSPVLFGLAGYLALSLLLGVFSKIYTPYPKAIFGAGIAMGLVILINYLPGVETALNLTTRIL